MRTATMASFGVLLLVWTGCDSGGPGAVGAPCNTADDCEGSLICDVHNDQGSCQEPHGHGGETEDSSDGSGTTSTTDTPDPATSTSTTDTPSETSGTTSGGDESSSSGGDESSTSGGSSELCAAFCGCMTATCSSYDAYPYADEAACMAACEAFDEAQLNCFGGFCQQAMDSEGTLAEHYCEHAWGALGDEKC